MHEPQIGSSSEHRLADRRSRAIEGAKSAVASLAKLGVTAVVTGSLARGDFGHFSDVDLLVTQCPRSLKYAIEGIVEDALGAIPFDVLYLDELPDRMARRVLEAAVDAPSLR
jgi:predicted nucleotidyltransferase